MLRYRTDSFGIANQRHGNALGNPDIKVSGNVSKCYYASAQGAATEASVPDVCCVLVICFVLFFFLSDRRSTGKRSRSVLRARNLFCPFFFLSDRR